MPSDPQYSGKLKDPEFRRQRAVKAGLARNSVKAYVASIVRRADQLTDEDIQKLRALLPPTTGEAQAR